MPAYNTTFDLTPEDLDLIEAALRDKQRNLSEAAMKGCSKTQQMARGMHDLLGRLHNQKVFYRPKRDAYIGG
jgi:hypothetical protein